MDGSSELNGEPPSGLLGSVVDAGRAAVEGLGDVVPNLLDRSRRQLRFAAAVLERATSCTGVRPGGETRPEPRLGDATHPGSSDDRGDAGPVPPPRLVSVPEATEATEAPEAESLAIVDYDSLAASQVLPRLAGLDAEELEAVASYERAHRNRKTILGRIAQLQG